MADAQEYVELAKRSSDVAAAVRKCDPGEDEPVEQMILTEDDVKLAQRGLPLQQYNAFVLYADEDVEFATEVIERMEGSGLKVSDRAFGEFLFVCRWISGGRSSPLTAFSHLFSCAKSLAIYWAERSVTTPSSV